MPSDATDGEWIVHYYDRRVDRDEASPGFASQDEALRHACELMRKHMTLKEVRGPHGMQIGAAKLELWCRSQPRPPARPRQRLRRPEVEVPQDVGLDYPRRKGGEDD